MGEKVVASCCDIEVSSLGNVGSLGASRTRHAPRPFKSAKVLVESFLTEVDTAEVTSMGPRSMAQKWTPVNEGSNLSAEHFQ